MKLIVGTFVTLDGVMQAPGGPEEDRSGGFTHGGGWLVPHFDETMGRIMTEWIAQADGVLLGRKTYDSGARATTEDRSRRVSWRSLGRWPHDIS